MKSFKLELICMYVLCFVCICLIFTSMIMLFVKNSYKLQYKSATVAGVGFKFETELPTKDEIKQEIDKLFNNPNYSLEEICLDSATAGISNVFTKQVYIDKNLSVISYAFTLAHELTHITKFTASERYCNFNAWLVLYKSENEFLKNVALSYADSDFKGEVIKEYSCAGYIEEYLSRG